MDNYRLKIRRSTYEGKTYYRVYLIAEALGTVLQCELTAKDYKEKFLLSGFCNTALADATGDDVEIIMEAI